VGGVGGEVDDGRDPTTGDVSGASGVHAANGSEAPLGCGSMGSGGTGHRQAPVVALAALVTLRRWDR
jgi:hypothetical protein